MKDFIYFIILILAASSLMMSCGDNSTTTAPPQQEVNKIFFNGAGYNNVSAFPYLTAASYNSGNNRTGLAFQCKINADTVILLLYFPGQATGTFPWLTANNYAMFYKSGASTLYYNSAGSGTTEITSYGSVGQKIEGNFNGKLNTWFQPYDTVSVSCDKFSVTRNMY